MPPRIPIAVPGSVLPDRPFCRPLGRWRGFAHAAIFVSVLLTTSEARAEGQVEAARAAYARGAALYDASDFSGAATELARADELASNDVALALAIKAATKADNPALTMTLAARADDRVSTKLREARDVALSKMTERVGTLKLWCPKHDCTATLDGTPVSPEAARYVNPGAHIVTVTSGGRSVTYARSFTAGASLLLGAPAPAPPPSEAQRATPGISPAWFWVGAALTTTIGGVTLASALDTRAKHDAFLMNSSDSLARDGEAAQSRTNALAVGFVAAAAITMVVGIVVLRSSRSEARTIPTQAMRR